MTKISLADIKGTSRFEDLEGVFGVTTTVDIELNAGEFIQVYVMHGRDDIPVVQSANPRHRLAADLIKYLLVKYGD